MSKDTQVTIRLEAELADRAEALVAKLGGVATRAAILREAMKAGLEVLESKYEDLAGPAQSAKRSRK